MVPAVEEAEIGVVVDETTEVFHATDPEAAAVPVATPLAEEVMVSVFEDPRTMVDVPRFFSEMAKVEVEPLDVELGPPTSDAETIWSVVEVAPLLASPNTEAVTTPPTPRTAAMMMNRSMLCEIADRDFVVFTSSDARAVFNGPPALGKYVKALQPH
jgi:hypothetical protein